MFLMKWTLFCLAIIVVIVISHSGEPHFLKWICPPCNQPPTTFRPPSRNWVMVSADAKKRKRLSLKRNNSLSTFSPTMEGNWFNFSIESDSPLILGEDCLVDRTAIFTTASQPLAFCRTFNLIWFPITWLSTRWVHLTFARQPTRAGGHQRLFLGIQFTWFDIWYYCLKCMQSLGRNWEPLGQKWVYWGIWSGMVGYGRLSSNMLDHPYTKHKYTNVQLHKTYTQLHKYGLASRLWQYSHPYINVWKIPKSYFSQFQNVVFWTFDLHL